MWPAGAREPVRLTQEVMHCTKQTHIDLHTQTPPCLCKRVIWVKCRVGVTQTGVLDSCKRPNKPSHARKWSFSQKRFAASSCRMWAMTEVTLIIN